MNLHYPKSYKNIGIASGVLLGLALGILCLFLRLLFLKIVSADIFFFIFIFTVFPAAFAAFGMHFGFLRDEMALQKASLENLNRVLEFRQKSLEETHDALASQAVMDHITGLYNRRYLLIEMEKEIERARRQKYTKPLLHSMMIDIDNFKHINDHYGHNTGDYVLQQVASVIKRSVRKIDLVGRYAGDEFLIILPECDETTAQTVATRIQEGMKAHPFEADGKRFNVTLSIGVAPFHNLAEYSDLSSFIENIDWSLLTAKREGKNRVIMNRLAS